MINSHQVSKPGEFHKQQVGSNSKTADANSNNFRTDLLNTHSNNLKTDLLASLLVKKR